MMTPRPDHARPNRPCFDALLFDFDGVLAESLEIKADAFRHIYDDHGEEFIARVLAYHQEHGGISRVEKIRHYHRDWLGLDVGDEVLDELAAKFSQLVEDDVIACDWVPGARETLDAWQPLVPLYVISGTPEDELRRICDGRGMSHYFTGVRGSPTRKEPIIEEIVAEHGLDRSRTLFIGDTMTDWRAANATGLQFLGRLIPSEETVFPAGTETVTDLHPLAAMAAGG